MPKNPQKMMRKNGGKPKLSFVLDFPNAMEQVSRVMEAGAEKYERNNWKNGAPFSEMEDSMMRHILAFHNCKDDDVESAQSHLAHIICNASFIMETYERFGGEFDDRDWENAE